MAIQWGYNTLGPGQSVGFYFIRTANENFLPYISVYAWDQASDTQEWSLTTPGGYPYWNMLGISTQWCQRALDNLGYPSLMMFCIVVQNNGAYPVGYSFLEADF